MRTASKGRVDARQRRSPTISGTRQSAMAMLGFATLYPYTVSSLLARPRARRDRNRCASVYRSTTTGTAIGPRAGLPPTASPYLVGAAPPPRSSVPRWERRPRRDLRAHRRDHRPVGGPPTNTILGPEAGLLAAVALPGGSGALAAIFGRIGATIGPGAGLPPVNSPLGIGRLGGRRPRRDLEKPKLVRAG
jgi:hypothetical protein